MCYEHHGMKRSHVGNCWRQFLTKEEKIELLEEYKNWLEKETKGVKEKIDDLKKAS
jgi:hypothetical protein